MPLSPAIQQLVTSTHLSQQQAENLTTDASLALCDARVREFITRGRLTMAQVLALTTEASVALCNAGVREFITTGRLTMEQVLTLTTAASVALCDAGVRALITADRLTMAQVLTLTTDASLALCNARVREFIITGMLTMEQVLALTHAARVALCDQYTQLQLRLGRIAIADILGPVHHHAHGVAAVVPNINASQSTHNASVHQAVSESATRLANRYRLMIDGTGLESVILMAQSYVTDLSDNSEKHKAAVRNLSDDSEKHKAAKRCVLRITAPNYTFTDPGSHITTRQLLALTFLAISDGGNRVGSLEDARAQFVEGLYEIQRGYNLSELGVDKGGQDISICSAGTFNKLIEKLQGIHPDCQIRFITRETASLKLPIVAREEAMQYLASLANPSTVEELQAFTQLMSEVKKCGFEVIWAKIKDKIIDRMFDEFGSLYRHRADHSFTSLIEAGQYAELTDLSIFQEQVQNSEGYHQFCSQMLRRSSMFSSQEKSADYLSEHRHDSRAAQQEYDQQFGLVLRK